MPSTCAQNLDMREGGRGTSGAAGGGGMTSAAACPASSVLWAAAGSTWSARPIMMISVLPRRTTAPDSSTMRPVIGTPLTSVPFRLPRSTTDSATGLGTSLR